MALSKEEIAAIRHVRAMMTSRYQREQACFAPFDKKAHREIVKATELWRETWVIPLLDSLLGKHRKHGYKDREEGLRHGF